MLKKHYENLLMDKIRENGGNITSPDEIWDNLKYLAKRVPHYDEEVCYLPLPIKKMLAYIYDPNRVIDYTLTMNQEGMLTCEAYVRWSSTPEGTVAGRGQVSRYIDQIFPSNSLSEHERKSVWNQSVISLAISRALTDAGIGMEFYGDCFDMSIDALETSDLEASKDRVAESKEDKLPEIPTVEEKKAKKMKAWAEKANAESKKLSEEKAAPEPVQQNASETPDAEVTANSVTTEQQNTSAEKDVPDDAQMATTLSLSEAREVIADRGTYAGNALGLIYDRSPRVIIWLYNNSQTDEVKNAAKTIIAQDETLQKLMYR